MAIVHYRNTIDESVAEPLYDQDSEELRATYEYSYKYDPGRSRSRTHFVCYLVVGLQMTLPTLSTHNPLALPYNRGNTATATTQRKV